MTKFADELFADLMREHGPALGILDRPVPREAIRRPLTARPGVLAGRPRPPRRHPWWTAPVAAAAGVTLAVGLAAVLGSRVHFGGPAGQAGEGRAETAYVFNGYRGTLTPISPVTGKLGKPVTVGPGASIVQNFILPDGTADYALYFNKPSKGAAEVVRRTSLVTGAAGQPVQLGRGAQQMVITPDGGTAYVTYGLGANNTVRPVWLSAGTVGKPILRVPGAGALSITPDGRTVYVPCLRLGRVTPISTATNTPGKPIPVPGAWRVVFTRNGRTAFVIGVGGGGRGGTVTPISTATNTPGRTITIEPLAMDLAFTPDGKTVYAVNPTSVTPISTRTGRAGKPIPLRGADIMVIAPNGRTGYVANLNYNRVTPISLATNTAGKPLNVTGSPLNIVITPDGRTAYAYSAMVDEKQVVTPISTATRTPGKPIRITAPSIEVLVPGHLNPPQ